MANRKNTLLTRAELRFMNIIWENDESTIRDIRENMPDGENIPYTTVATIVRVLAKKGFLHQRLQGKTMYYKAAVDKRDYESRTIDQMVKNLFNSTPVSLATRLIDDHDLTAEELAEIKAILDRKLEDESRKKSSA